MSWLNKFLKMFQEKDEIYDHERSIVEYNQEIKNDKKELETRVTYYYPKGQETTPILSNKENKPKQTNRVRPKRELRNQNSDKEEVLPLKPFANERSERKNARLHEKKINQQEQIQPEMKLQEKIIPVKYVEQQDQKTQSEPKKLEQKIETRTKVTKKSSRPFRPTEIPSPIYGFSKRPHQTEVVEFELTSDEKLLEIEQRIFSVSNTEQVATINHEEQPATIKHGEQAATINHGEQPATINHGEQAATINHGEQPATINHEEQPATINHEEQLTTIIHGEQVSTINHEEEPATIYHEELAATLIHEEDASSTEYMEEVFEDNVIEIEESDYLQEELNEDLEKELDITSESDGELEENLPIENEMESRNEDLEKKPTQRSHLPFNVLMLNQDKRKWEQKRIERAVQQEMLSPISQEKVVSTTEIEITESNQLSNGYIFPNMELLNPPMTRFAQENIDWIENQEHLLNEALKNFGVRANVVNVTQGPSVTRFEVQPEPGVKVNKITNLSDDIKLSLAAKDIRIEAPIPGKHTIGIEVPNKKSRPVLISEIIRTESFQKSSSPLTAVLGLDISGAPVVTDLKKMPHGLIAGATGSGKSVCINSILISLLYKASPHELKLLLIDPKMVELAPYNHIPHLVSPVITDVKAATAALKWAVDEMERRYELFAHTGVRDINRFNEIAEQHKRYSDKLPFIVIIIDELADLMMMSPADVEESICRIAQKARACGIHLIIATQRPSVDVITGLIKANVPTRTAFSVSSQIDSRTIIDISGAEKLLGRGDMLFLENGSSKPVRLQGTFVSDAEIDLVVEHVRKQQEPEYLFQQEELLKRAQVIEDEDELFYEACEFVIEQGGASTSSVQRRFKIGYNRAARLIDMMEQQGFISEPKGSKPRDVLITEEALEQIQENTSSSFI
ncbi:DNA translocase FtsK [Pseudoneobacillus rhizosphaerae]|uniref:DNA translocase FtsK n=1 Tax=Pseudoneobacillus rhizosphaerae TaxID=2880968 RepID=UPI003F495E93